MAAILKGKEELFSLSDKVDQLTFDMGLFDAHGNQLPREMRKYMNVLGTNFRTHFRQARRVSLSNSFLDRVVDKATPEQLIKRCDLANLPFDYMWLEWDQDYRTKISENLGISRPFQFTDSGYAEAERGLSRDMGRVGAFLAREKPEDASKWTASLFVEDKNEGIVAMSIIGLAFDDDQILLESSNKHLRNMQDYKGVPYIERVWGSMFDEEGNYLLVGDMKRRILNSRATFIMEPFIGGNLDKIVPYNILYDQLQRDMIGATGDIRFLVTVLATLNTPMVKFIKRESPGRYQWKLRNHTYMDYSLVEIDTTKVRTQTMFDRVLDKAWKEDYAKRRAHEVRGFWKNVEYGKSKFGCAHIPVAREGDYALCEKCGNLIKWVDHHMRGDASIGFVQHDYNLKR